MSQPLDNKVTNTTKLVLGLLRKGQLFDQGYCVYMDNYYTSPKLLSECFYRCTYGAGTVCSNRQNLPKGVVQAKLQKGETCFHQNNELLCIKWCDKKSVMLLTTIHDAVETNGKKDRNGDAMFKPKCLVEYTNNMRGCDLADQLMSSYCLLRRSVKWWHKLFSTC